MVVHAVTVVFSACSVPGQLCLSSRSSYRLLVLSSALKTNQNSRHLQGFYSVLYEPSTFWIGPAVIALFVVLTPLFLWLAHRNEYTHDVVRHGWEPVIAAMAISR